MHAVRVALVATVAVAFCVLGCGGTPQRAEPSARTTSSPSAPVATREDLAHVHGLGINPADDALYIATHEGLFKSAADSTDAVRVGDLRHDTMGFAVAGPDHFLGSGHPADGTDDPPLLGLIQSDDAGRSWSPIAREGLADLHVLRVGKSAFYAADAVSGELYAGVVGDQELLTVARPPGTLVDLAINPDDSRQLTASTDRGLYTTEDAARTWRPLTSDRSGLLTYHGRQLLLVKSDGTVEAGASGGRVWQRVGRLPGPPTALISAAGSVLAGVEGRILKSGDGGGTWTKRVATAD